MAHNQGGRRGELGRRLTTLYRANTMLSLPSGSFDPGKVEQALGQSLDSIIKQKRSSSSGANVAKAIGGAKAKREAALAARRGLSASSKPDAMEVDKQVKRMQDHINRRQKALQQKAKNAEESSAKKSSKRAARRRTRQEEGAGSKQVGARAKKGKMVDTNKRAPPSRAGSGGSAAKAKAGKAGAKKLPQAAPATSAAHPFAGAGSTFKIPKDAANLQISFTAQASSSKAKPKAAKGKVKAAAGGSKTRAEQRKAKTPSKPKGGAGTGGTAARAAAAQTKSKSLRESKMAVRRNIIAVADTPKSSTKKKNPPAAAGAGAEGQKRRGARRGQKK
jgi:hypothetical protein